MGYRERGRGSELCSTTVKAGHRVYFVDAKEDSQGNKYVAISECKSARDGGARDRQRIHIYEEDLGKILEAFGGALVALGYELEINLRKREQNSGEYSVSSPISEVNIPSMGDFISEE